MDAGGEAEIIQAGCYEPNAANPTYRVDRRIAERLLYRGEEHNFEWVQGGPAHRFDADGDILRLLL
jgi:hypothetical protein